MKEIVVKLNKDNKRKAPGYVPEIKGRTKSRGISLFILHFHIIKMRVD
jgi:hypothetical protein